jgi:membrane-associated phospholipid phosphatase
MQTTELSFYKFMKLVKNPIFFISWLALASISYFFFDKALAFYFNDLHQPALHAVAYGFTLLGYGGPYIIGFFLVFILAKYIIKKPKIAHGALYLFLSVTAAGILCDIIKVILGRSRPVELFHNGIYGFYFLQTKASFVSFPSGHATVIAAVMIGLSYLFPRFWKFFLALLFLTSISRIILTAHFLSDIMIGMYLGGMCATLIYEFITKHSFLQLNAKKVSNYGMISPF